MNSPQHAARPDAQALLAQALRHHRAGRLGEAIQHYENALALDADFTEAHYNLGCALHAQGKLADAVRHYERAIALHPGFAPAHVNLGNAVKDLGRLEEAVAHYERAIALDPGHADAHYNLATAYKDQGRFAAAKEHYRHTLESDSNHVSAHNNIGVLLRDEGRLDDALRHFRAATLIKPEHAESHVNEAMLLLLAGDYAAGWKKYEWRWRVKDARPLASDKSLWDGGDLTEKTILLHGEQGLGDSLQFVRYAEAMKARGARVLLACPPALARLFSGISAVDAVIPEGSPLPVYDCHAPLMSLPMLLGTTLENVPNTVPYLHPIANEVATWARRIPESKGLKVGLAWAGHSRHNHPAARAVDRRRSMQLDQFAPLAQIPGIRLFSLQKGIPARQIETAPPALSLIDLTADIHDFADTAALVANLDLVIGVDTSVIHLAGAMGKPVWVLSRFDGCWRWLLGREDSPWYPSLRLFRQPAPGDWESVIAAVTKALRELAGA